MKQQRVRSGVNGAVVLLAGLCCCLALACNRADRLTAPPPPASLDELFGESLYTADESAVGIQALEDKAVIAIYFAARLCPACGAFTPLLVNAYDELRQAARSFEVVLVSSDASSREMFNHMRDSGMPWLAVPQGSSVANGLLQRYGIRWIPTLVVLDSAGRTLSLNGRVEIEQHGAAAYDLWLARRAPDEGS